MDVLERLQKISDTIAETCRQSNRNPKDVELMLVTKTVPVERILPAIQAGYKIFGENKIQEAVQKWVGSDLAPTKPEFIGHLQTNKVKTCLDVCGRIHSLDRVKLAEVLDRELQARGESREVFLQVNSSNEESKFGVSIEDALSFAKEMRHFSSLKVTGLMTLALFSSDQEAVRSCFQRMKSLFDEIQKQDLYGTDFRHLSMGMSGDYQIAIAEGATIVRVGTAIFGERNTPNSYYWPEDKQ